MNWLWCLVIGHQKVRVEPTGELVARPGGILPSIDGMMAYRPDLRGTFDACSRCGKVLGPHVFPS